MAPPQRVTAVFLDVIEYLTDRVEGAHGFDIKTATQDRSGSSYGVLARLVRSGWATASIGEDSTRLIYRLTPDGRLAAEALLHERRPPPPALAAS